MKGDNIMTVTVEKINSVMNSSIGSMTFYKREYGKNMDYTEGVMEVQRQLGMYWFVDMMYSHMPAVVEDHNKTEETFYVVKLDVNDDNTAHLTITREHYDKVSDDYKDIIIAEQHIDYTDLPKCTMKFFLELASWEPLVFRLLCPSEH